MTELEKETIECLAWQQLRNCKYYKEKGCENCLRYEIGRLMATIHIMIEMEIPIREIIEASKEFNEKQLIEKKEEGF